MCEIIRMIEFNPPVTANWVFISQNVDTIRRPIWYTLQGVGPTAVESCLVQARNGNTAKHIRSRYKERSKQADEASAQSDLPRAAVGKRGAQEAGLGEAEAARQPQPR